MSHMRFDVKAADSWDSRQVSDFIEFGELLNRLVLWSLSHRRTHDIDNSPCHPASKNIPIRVSDHHDKTGLISEVASGLVAAVATLAIIAT